MCLLTSACSSQFLETHTAPREPQGKQWGADLTFAPRHLKSHFMETLFTRPLDCDLPEATEPVQATAAQRLPSQWTDSASECAGHLASTLWGAGRGWDSPYSGSRTNSEGSLGRLIPQGLLALTLN